MGLEVAVEWGKARQKAIHLGTFDTAEEAAQAFRTKWMELHGQELPQGMEMSRC